MADPEVACSVCARKASHEGARCKTQWYCSRDCQKVDWKTHKKGCGQHASSSTAQLAQFEASRPKNLSDFIEKPFTALQNKTWLHNRHEADVYQLLIDCYRLRMDDQYKFQGEVDPDSIYSGEGGPAGGESVLPAWWSETKAEDCVAFGLKSRSEWSSLACAVEKSEVIEHYGDPTFPMQLRMLGEQIYGTGPGDMMGGSGSGAMMLSMMVMKENGDINVGLLNTAF
ncbi:zinc finger MYND domain-containing protein [Aspergillus saccharolyticus JOP 1030-1]|uniref:MYND-type domain-containing protein n=1 Tax=Aspergillus saccharolyticus JOP 1030-1 TaxID=1450539 RepID=A0A319A3B5_9EURO|nr:hypothetical protein BP01DRAFT_390875 [Aspergillus saccharolyticus JOP 1030-1]PYH46638.1 hypothetical protein BP01DRAFT_390875 [Aspergillus saccharolyticus JOP 1030-1]